LSEYYIWCNISIPGHSYIVKPISSNYFVACHPLRCLGSSPKWDFHWMQMILQFFIDNYSQHVWLSQVTIWCIWCDRYITVFEDIMVPLEKTIKRIWEEMCLNCKGNRKHYKDLKIKQLFSISRNEEICNPLKISRSEEICHKVTFRNLNGISHHLVGFCC
jgi:hypothetical protein